MKVFLSWSGSHSREIAKHLHDWIENTFDDTQAWYSETDINAGADWATSIRKQLANIHVGVLCLTKENQNRPWILFEAGAISKKLDKACVIPLLIGADTRLELPLSMFQAALASQDGVRRIFWTINEQKKSGRLKPKAFNGVFKNSWRNYGKAFLGIVKNHKPSGPEPAATADNVLSQIEALNRDHQKSTPSKKNRRRQR